MSLDHPAQIRTEETAALCQQGVRIVHASIGKSSMLLSPIHTFLQQPPNTKAVALSLRSELPPFLIWVSLFGLHKPIAESNGAVFAYINAMLFPSVALGPMTAVEAEDVVSCVQAMLELSSMVAPRTHVDLRLKGFALEVGHFHLWGCLHQQAHMHRCTLLRGQPLVRVRLRHGNLTLRKENKTVYAFWSP